MKISIYGAGGFGTALAVMCAQNGQDVSLYSPFPEELETIRRDGEHRKLLPGVPVPETVRLTSSLPETAGCGLALIAAPSFAVRSTAEKLRAVLEPGIPVACVSKGLEDGTLKTMSAMIREELPHNPCVILSGPSHAEEVARGIPTTIVAASQDRPAAEAVQDSLMNPSLRIYVNDDVPGVELGGALKNVIALAAGISDGLGLGDNPKAALMTRGITEIARLGVVLGAKTETFAGLSGIGDLIVTCTSMHSRNRRAGMLIGQGKKAQEAVAEIGMTVEGYKCAKAANALAEQTGVEMPITAEVCRVLYEDKDPRQALKDLMGRPKRHESEVIWLLQSGRPDRERREEHVLGDRPL